MWHIEWFAQLFVTIAAKQYISQFVEPLDVMPQRWHWQFMIWRLAYSKHARDRLLQCSFSWSLTRGTGRFCSWGLAAWKLTRCWGSLGLWSPIAVFVVSIALSHEVVAVATTPNLCPHTSSPWGKVVQMHMNKVRMKSSVVWAKLYTVVRWCMIDCADVYYESVTCIMWHIWWLLCLKWA